MRDSVDGSNTTFVFCVYDIHRGFILNIAKSILVRLMYSNLLFSASHKERQ